MSLNWYRDDSLFHNAYWPLLTICGCKKCIYRYACIDFEQNAISIPQGSVLWPVLSLCSVLELIRRWQPLLISSHTVLAAGLIFWVASSDLMGYLTVADQCWDCWLVSELSTLTPASVALEGIVLDMYCNTQLHRYYLLRDTFFTIQNSGLAYLHHVVYIAIGDDKVWGKIMYNCTGIIFCVAFFTVSMHI